VHEWRFEALAHLAPSAQPTFVFAHILLPHEPFLFDRDCSHLRSWTPGHLPSSNRTEVVERYGAQVQCLNRMVVELARTLVTGRDPAPIVIFQSDHGYGRLGVGWSDSLHEMAPDQVQERLGIFAAYHVPGIPRFEIPETTTPVNAVRGIFRRQFGLDLPPLPERSYWSSYGNLFRFEPVPRSVSSQR
jgi:hypothetical protein